MNTTSSLGYKYDIVILTDKRYDNPTKTSDYIANVLKEDSLIQLELEKLGYSVWRTFWDNPTFDWSTTKAVLFRTTWDYFERFDEFINWLNHVNTKTKLINSFELINWNIDKHYLKYLQTNGIRIVPTKFIEIGNSESLNNLVNSTNWDTVILKPAIAGAARHTYKITRDKIVEYEAIFKNLICNEAMLLQPFLSKIVSKGEITLVLFGGKYSHAILKQAKKGDFRVQDDFGGSVYNYNPNEKEIKFAEKVISACPTTPIYARVDLMWDDNDELCVSEVECIEPELWMRNNDNAAGLFAKALRDLTSLEPSN